MKVALCLSGNPRFLEDAYPSIRDNIISRNDVIVFAHSWKNPENYQHKYSAHNYDPNWKSYNYDQSKCFDFINQYYQPAIFKIDDAIEYKNDAIITEKTYEKYYRPDLVGNTEFRHFQIRNSYGMFRSILECNLLKKNYERQHNFTFDYVIRCRYDAIIGQPVLCHMHDPSYVWYEEMGQPDGMVSDWFNLSNSPNMDVYSSVYNVWEVLYGRLMHKMQRWCNELLVKEILDIFSIKYSSTYWALRIPRR